MNCDRPPERAAAGECSICRIPMCDECLSSPLAQNSMCLTCSALQSSKEASATVIKEQTEAVLRQEDSQQNRKRRKKSILVLTVALVVAAIIVILIQIPVLRASFAPDQPVRIGTYKTNMITDECLEFLWETARGLQSGRLPGPDSVCPGGDKPLTVSREHEDVVVRFPNPERYGFKEIRVTKKYPVPEVIR